MSSSDDPAQIFDQLFPSGLFRPEILEAIAPEGWEASPLARGFESSPPGKSSILSALLPWRKPNQPSSRADPQRECAQLVAAGLWHVFAEHEVVGPDGEKIDLGSWRGVAEEIADWLNRSLGDDRYQYTRFYMGQANLTRHRVDLAPVFRLIFARFRQLEMDWQYDMPRLDVVTLGEPDEHTVRMKADLDAADRRARQNARDVPAPSIVKAFQEVFGRLPAGWPPEV